MTIDDWRARYDHLNAEADRLRAEVERLKGQLELEENNGPYPDFSCGTFAAQRGIELKPAGGPTYTTTIKHWRGLIEERDAARAEVERLREDADKLRVLLATSNANCAFCGLPAAEMAKCASDFPGCSRADDMILCVHPTRQDLLAEVERLREHQERARWCEEMKADVNYGFHSGGVYVHEWFVQWDGIGTAHCVRHPDRNAAIDAAMKGGK